MNEEEVIKEIESLSPCEVACDKILELYKSVKSDLYEANNRINDLLDIVKLKDKIIDEILKTWKQDDVRSIAELKKYFEERCK